MADQDDLELKIIGVQESYIWEVLLLLVPLFLMLFPLANGHITFNEWFLAIIVIILFAFLSWRSQTATLTLTTKSFSLDYHTPHSWSLINYKHESTMKLWDKVYCFYINNVQKPSNGKDFFRPYYQRVCIHFKDSNYYGVHRGDALWFTPKDITFEELATVLNEWKNRYAPNPPDYSIPEVLLRHPPSIAYSNWQEAKICLMTYGGIAFVLGLGYLILHEWLPSLAHYIHTKM